VPSLLEAIPALVRSAYFVLHAFKLDSEMLPLLLETKPCVCVFSVFGGMQTAWLRELLEELQRSRKSWGGMLKDPLLRVVVITEDQQMPLAVWSKLGVQEVITAPIYANALTFKLSHHYRKALAAERRQEQLAALHVAEIDERPGENLEWRGFEANPAESVIPPKEREPEERLHKVELEVELMGQDEGEWELEAEAESNDQVWTWHRKIGEGGQPPEQPPPWTFRGDKPRFDPVRKSWVLSGERPELLRTGTVDAGADSPFAIKSLGKEGGGLSVQVKKDLRLKSVKVAVYPGQKESPEEIERRSDLENVALKERIERESPVEALARDPNSPGLTSELEARRRAEVTEPGRKEDRATGLGIGDPAAPPSPGKGEASSDGKERALRNAAETSAKAGREASLRSPMMAEEATETSVERDLAGQREAVSKLASSESRKSGGKGAGSPGSAAASAKGSASASGAKEESALARVKERSSEPHDAKPMPGEGGGSAKDSPAAPSSSRGVASAAPSSGGAVPDPKAGTVAPGRLEIDRLQRGTPGKRPAGSDPILAPSGSAAEGARTPVGASAESAAKPTAASEAEPGFRDRRVEGKANEPPVEKEHRLGSQDDRSAWSQHEGDEEGDGAAPGSRRLRRALRELGRRARAGVSQELTGLAGRGSEEMVTPLSDPSLPARPIPDLLSKSAPGAEVPEVERDQGSALERLLRAVVRTLRKITGD
jgi:hypothetical protein